METGYYHVTLTITNSSGQEDERTQAVAVRTGLEGDINGHCKVYTLDVAIVSKAFGSYPEDDNRNPDADIDCDAKVDIFDVAYVASRYGDTC
jgi:hypothetical protein